MYEFTYKVWTAHSEKTEITVTAKNKEEAIAPFIAAAELAKKIGLKINAGHDLSLENLKYFSEKIPFLAEVSIGHALICDALYFGLEKTIIMYKQLLVK